MGDTEKRLDRLDGSMAEIHDDVDSLKAGHEKLLKASTEASQKVGSMEKQLILLCTDSSQKFGTLERQFALISETLARMEACSFSDMTNGRGIASTSHLPVQVVKLQLR
ncbi:hypothetical protein Bca101_059142 [Brassica carinata]